jgi:hypothetical protein
MIITITVALKMRLNLIKHLTFAIIAVAANVTTGQVSAQTLQKFTVSYSVNLTLDQKQANATGMSKSMISALSGIVGNAVTIADVSDTVKFTKDTYHIQSTGTLKTILAMFVNKGSFVRISDGQISGSTLNTLRYVDIRASNPPLTTLIDEKNNNILFYSGKTKTGTAPYKNKIRDVLSLGYSFIGKLPTSAVSTMMSDGKSIKEVVFDMKKETITLPTGRTDTIKLTRRLADRGDASVEYWLRASDGIPLRMRIGMNERYGVVLDMVATAVPTKVLGI